MATCLMVAPKQNGVVHALVAIAACILLVLVAIALMLFSAIQSASAVQGELMDAHTELIGAHRHGGELLGRIGAEISASIDNQTAILGAGWRQRYNTHHQVEQDQHDDNSHDAQDRPKEAGAADRDTQDHGATSGISSSAAESNLTAKHRGLQGGDGAPLCTEGSLASRSDAVTAVCCDEVHEDCSSGAPTNCNQDCAEILLPFVSECRYLFSAELRNAFKDSVTMCSTGGSSTGTGNSSNLPNPPQVGACTDSSIWVGDKGQRCPQYDASASPSWHFSCNIDYAVAMTEAAARSAAMFGTSTAIGLTAAEACPVSCRTCPTCFDGVQNGLETGVDCGGPCPSICMPDAACEPFAMSAHLPENMDAVCTDGAGTSAGAVCHTVAQPGYFTGGIGAAVAACGTAGERQALASTAMVPPRHLTPGQYICTFGSWQGFPLAAIRIVPNVCGLSVKENHYSATCADSTKVCQATCDKGYKQAGGDGKWDARAVLNSFFLLN